ncbi:MAG: VOC family protein [Gemmatimonas sp.]
MNVANAPFTVPPPRYQLPAALTLGPVTLQVASLDRSIVYYERVLGLRTFSRDGSRATLGTQDGETVLIELHEKPGVRPVPPRGLLGLYHFAILLPDRASLGRFLAHLRDLGVRVGMSDHLVSEALYLTDPDGLGIEVYADRPRDSWRMQGRAIAMAADPLDVVGVIAAGNNVAWSGMPAGTRMGHVHLHVGDLQTAAKFFHEALGFDVVTLQYPGALFMSAGGYHHHLGTNTWAAGAPVATSNDARLLEWRIQLPLTSDLADVAAALAQSGLSVRQDDGEVIVTDPWGTDLRIGA